MQNKAVLIKSIFANSLEPITEEVPTGEIRKNWLGSEKEITETKTKLIENDTLSDSRIDGDQLEKDINQAIEKLNNEGYEVVSFTNITSGNYNYTEQRDQTKNHSFGLAYGYGYSYTEGVMILAKKDKQFNKPK